MVSGCDIIKNAHSEIVKKAACIYHRFSYRVMHYHNDFQMYAWLIMSPLYRGGDILLYFSPLIWAVWACLGVYPLDMPRTPYRASEGKLSQ